MIQQLTHDDMPPYRLSKDQVVKRRHPIEIGRRHLEQFANVTKTFV
jgi:hypothetical protein